MIATTMKFLVIITFATCLVGCPGHINTGAIDYRPMAASPTNGDYYSLGHRYVVPADAYDEIGKNEPVSIHLMQAFIRDFSERFEDTMFSEEEVRGEIAIIARVVDRGRDKSGKFERASAENGRLVYYSDDVRRGQFLNFSYMPIYGPLEYSGQELEIELLILELDDYESAQYREIIKTLADIGGQAYPPSSAVLQVLESLADAILATADDDEGFRYRFTFQAPSNDPDLPRPTLCTGNYVIHRSEDRNKSIDWDSLQIDRRTGRLMTTSHDPPMEYRDETYLTVQIRNDGDPTPLEEAESYAEFYRRVIADDDAEGAELQAATTKLTTALVELRKKYNSYDKEKQ